MRWTQKHWVSRPHCHFLGQSVARWSFMVPADSVVPREPGPTRASASGGLVCGQGSLPALTSLLAPGRPGVSLSPHCGPHCGPVFPWLPWPGQASTGPLTHKDSREQNRGAAAGPDRCTLGAHTLCRSGGHGLSLPTWQGLSEQPPKPGVMTAALSHPEAPSLMSLAFPGCPGREHCADRL